MLYRVSFGAGLMDLSSSGKDAGTAFVLGREKEG